MKAIESKQVTSHKTALKHCLVQLDKQERITSVTGAEAATIITVAMERTENAIVEVRWINLAKEIGRRLILNIVNTVRMTVFVLYVCC